MPRRASSKTRLPGCRRCREQHLKCDRKRPSCSTCQNVKQAVTCTYEAKPLRFSHSQCSSSKQSVDQAQRNASSQPIGAIHHNEHSSTFGSSDNTNTDLEAPLASPFSPTSLQIRNQSSPPATALLGNVPSRTTHPPLQASYDHSTHHEVGTFQVDTTLTTPRGTLGFPTPDYSVTYASSLGATSTTKILTDELECQIFDFYIVHMGHWLDIGSPKHYFQNHIPQLALQEALVLYACLACAAQIMYLMGSLDKSVEERYNGKVLEILIPLLSSDQATSTNEVLLATTVILRMAEQFLELGQDAQRHLNGAASLFMDGTQWPLAEHNLATATFWTHLRESIRICFLREQAPLFDLGHLDVPDDYLDAGGVPEEVWTNRSTLLLLKVCKLCWGNNTQDAQNTANQLQASLLMWKGQLPLSFRPWSVREHGDQPFPVIKYFEPWHVVAWQFYYTSKIMLAVHFNKEQQASNVYRMRSHIEVDATFAF